MSRKSAAAPPAEKTGRAESLPLLKRVLMLLAILLLVPIVPFLIAGPSLEQMIEMLLQSVDHPGMLLPATAAALAADIFLPVPSSGLITYAGAATGLIPAALASTAGLTAGAALGYELSRLWGTPILARYASPDDVHRLEFSARRWAVTTVIASRALPILGETTVLLVGTLRMPRVQFYPAVLLANAAIATVYAGFGRYASQHVSAPVLIGISLIAPLLLTFLLRYLRPRQAADDAADGPAGRSDAGSSVLISHERPTAQDSSGPVTPD